MTINCEVLSNREEILWALCQAPRDHSPALLTSVDVRFASALGSITTNKLTNKVASYSGVSAAEPRPDLAPGDGHNHAVVVAVAVDGDARSGSSAGEEARGAGGDGGGSVAEREAAGQWAAACRGGEAVAVGEESLAVDAMLALTATATASGAVGVGPGDDTDVDDGDGGEDDGGPATANAAARDGLTLLEHCLDGPADPFSLANGTSTCSSSRRGPRDPHAPHPFPPLGQDDTLLALDRLRDLTTRTLLLQSKARPAAFSFLTLISL